MQTHQIFSVHSTPEEFQQPLQQSPLTLNLCPRNSIVLKDPLSKCFLSRLERKAGVFKFVRFEKHFRKAPLSSGIFHLTGHEKPLCVSGGSMQTIFPRLKSLLTKLIDHFTVVDLVTWPLNGSEAGFDLVLIQTSLLLLCKSSCTYQY